MIAVIVVLGCLLILVGMPVLFFWLQSRKNTKTLSATAQASTQEPSKVDTFKTDATVEGDFVYSQNTSTETLYYPKEEPDYPKEEPVKKKGHKKRATEKKNSKPRKKK